MGPLTPFVVLLGLVVSIEVLVLIEVLVPRKYRGKVRLIAIPFVFIVSAGVGLLSVVLEGVVVFSSSALLFFSNYLESGFDKVISPLKAAVERFRKPLSSGE